MANQPPNHSQFNFVIPVKRYRHVVRPNNGINDHCFIKANKASMMQMIQKIMVDTFNVVFDSSLLADADLISPTFIAAIFLPRVVTRLESGSHPDPPYRLWT